MANHFLVRFFDGKSIKGLNARLEVLENSLKIYVDDPIVVIEWPKESLQLMERPYQQKPAVIGCKNMMGARLIIENNEAFNSVLPLIPKKNIKLSHVHHPWRITWILIVVLLIVIISPIWHFPLVSLWVANLVPYAWEEDIWENEVKNRFIDAPECINPEGKLVLDKLVKKLANVSKTKHPFDVRVIDSPDFVNAESTPGFHLFLYSGLFNMPSPDSVAGVIAHEMGHSLKHHVMASFINHVGVQGFYSAVLGVSGENIAFDFLNLKFHRSYELQADKIAIDLLSKANISLKGYLQAMEFLAKNGREYTGLEPYLLDHPTHQERIDLIVNSKSVKDPIPSLTPEEWKTLKSICDKVQPMQFKSAK